MARLVLPLALALTLAGCADKNPDVRKKAPNSPALVEEQEVLLPGEGGSSAPVELEIATPSEQSALFPRPEPYTTSLWAGNGKTCVTQFQDFYQDWLDSAGRTATDTTGDGCKKFELKNANGDKIFKVELDGSCTLKVEITLDTATQERVLRICD